jgi:probable HAF family extracellular repeat protein
MTDLGTLGGGVSRAFAVNDLGHIVGEAETESGAMHAFLWEEGTMTDLGTLAGDYSSAWDINSHGQVVGLSTGQNGRLRAFLWADAQFSDLGTLGGGWSAAEGINDAGQIVGVSEVADGVVHAFLWEDGVMRDIHGLAAEESWAKAINISGAVVGYWKNPGLNGGGFVYDTQAGMRDLALYLPPDLNWSGGSGRDINDAGQIAGCTVVVEGGHGTNTAFLLTPIPEPASLALLGLGACAVLARAFVVDTHRGRVNSHIGF